MKKTLAIVLALVIVLSLSVSAFAANSPTGTINAPVEDDPSWYEGGWTAPAAPVAPAAEELTAEEQEQADTAEAAAEDEGYVVEEVKVVSVAEGETLEVPVEIANDQVVLVYSKDGKLLMKLTPELLAQLGGVIKLSESCTIVIAK